LHLFIDFTGKFLNKFFLHGIIWSRERRACIRLVQGSQHSSDDINKKSVMEIAP